MHACDLLNNGSIGVKETLNTVLDTLSLAAVQGSRGTIVDTLVKAQVGESVNGRSHLGLVGLGLGPHSNLLFLRISKIGNLVHRHFYWVTLRSLKGPSSCSGVTLL